MSCRWRPISLGVCLFILLSWADGRAVEKPRDGLAELVALRAHFVQDMEKTAESEELSAKALIFTGRAWAVAARHLSGGHHPAELHTEFVRMEKELLAELEQNDQPNQGQVLGLKLFYHSARTVARTLAFLHRDNLADQEIKAIDDDIIISLETERGPGYSLTALSSGAMSLLALAVRTIDQRHRFFPEINRELAHRVEAAQIIQRREDIHYRGKMFLLALNNIEGCFQVACAFSLAVDQRLAVVIEPIKQSWLKHLTPQLPPAAAMVVTSTALAEASFPAAMALIRRFGSGATSVNSAGTGSMIRGGGVDPDLF